MKRICALILCGSLVLLFAGCESNKTKVGEGSVIGGVLGAAAGAGLGSLSGNAGLGAGIGAAAGAIGGGLIGSQMEKKPADTVNPKQLSVQQIVNMVKQGVSDDVIIKEIVTTRSVFNLSSAQIDNLKRQGVSQRVINAMQAKE